MVLGIWKKNGQYHGSQLLGLTHEMLRAIGISDGSAEVIIDAIAELRADLGLPTLAPALSAAMPASVSLFPRCFCVPDVCLTRVFPLAS